jgi:chromosome segregation ATPase
VSDAQDAAKAELDTAREQAAGLVAKAQAHKADIDALASQREAQAKEAQAKVTAAQLELATLEAKIRDAKAQIVKILG